MISEAGEGRERIGKPGKDWKAGKGLESREMIGKPGKAGIKSTGLVPCVSIVKPILFPGCNILTMLPFSYFSL
jgi:hypothetical protein